MSSPFIHTDAENHNSNSEDWILPELCQKIFHDSCQKSHEAQNHTCNEKICKIRFLEHDFKNGLNFEALAKFYFLIPNRIYNIFVKID